MLGRRGAGETFAAVRWSPSPLGAQSSRFLVMRGFFLFFFFPPFSLPSPDVRMFIKLRINLRPGDVQPGKHCADRVKGPSPARIIHPDVLIQAVRTNMRTSARGGAGKRFPKYEANVSQTRRSEAGERRSTTAERCPCPPPQRPTGLGRGGWPDPSTAVGARLFPASLCSLAGTEADLRSCRKYICYWERFDISHVKRLRAGGAQASGRKLP